MRIVLVLAMLLASDAASAQQVMDGSASEIGEPAYKRIVEALVMVANDPFSAQFAMLMRAQERPELVCGMVNLKNSYGAYTGFKVFAYDEKHERLLMDQNLSDCLH